MVWLQHGQGSLEAQEPYLCRFGLCWFITPRYQPRMVSFRWQSTQTGVSNLRFSSGICLQDSVWPPWASENSRQVLPPSPGPSSVTSLMSPTSGHPGHIPLLGEPPPALLLLLRAFSLLQSWSGEHWIRSAWLCTPLPWVSMLFFSIFSCFHAVSIIY